MADQDAARPGTDPRATSERLEPAEADAAAAGPADESGNGAANSENEQLRARVAQLEDQWKRALADLDNLRKRVARESDQQRSDERARVAALWLPVLDNLELALQHAGANPEAILSGVQAVRDQALAVLSALGYARRIDEGTKFDPARHEAVATVPDANATPGTVVHVVRPGYGDGERQLRPASVVVAARGE
jgi:molecular chaperone GrpE